MSELSSDTGCESIYYTLSWECSEQYRVQAESSINIKITLASHYIVLWVSFNINCHYNRAIDCLTQERKRWYILRRDLAEGYCLLEYYKDEKAAAKGADSIKGFINVHDVVDVRRVPDKKQMFEILCPGVGYRLVANSEVEADEWTDALKKLTLYRKDSANQKTLSLQRTGSTPSAPDQTEPIRERKRTLSDSAKEPQSSYPPPTLPPYGHRPLRQQQQLQSSSMTTHPNSLAIPKTTGSPGSVSTDIPTINLSQSLPTPPENAVAPSFSPPRSACFLSQPSQPSSQVQTLSKSAAELRAALPSPSTSSDSSSMCSGSNTSFDNQSTFEGEKNDSSKAETFLKRYDDHLSHKNKVCKLN